MSAFSRRAILVAIAFAIACGPWTQSRGQHSARQVEQEEFKKQSAELRETLEEKLAEIDLLNKQLKSCQQTAELAITARNAAQAELAKTQMNELKARQELAVQAKGHAAAMQAMNVNYQQLLNLAANLQMENKILGKMIDIRDKHLLKLEKEKASFFKHALQAPTRTKAKGGTLRR
jgi:hypothetical protein